MISEAPAIGVRTDQAPVGFPDAIPDGAIFGGNAAAGATKPLILDSNSYAFVVATVATDRPAVVLNPEPSLAAATPPALGGSKQEPVRVAAVAAEAPGVLAGPVISLRVGSRCLPLSSPTRLKPAELVLSAVGVSMRGLRSPIGGASPVSRYELSVVWTVEYDSYVVVSSATDQRWVVNDPGCPFEAGDFVMFSADGIQECSSDFVDRRPVLVDFVQGGRVYVSNGLSQREALNPHEFNLGPGSAVILAGGHVIEELAPQEHVRNTAEQVRRALDRTEPEGSPDRFRQKHEDIPEVDCVFAGYDQEVRDLSRISKHALCYRAAYDSFRTRPPRGVLLAGRPGTGKTTLARKIAKSTEADLWVVNGPEILSSPVGSTERTLRHIFDSGEEKNEPSYGIETKQAGGSNDSRGSANEESPAARVIFFDEIDALTMQRGTSLQDHNQQLVAQLLSLMDGFAPHAPRFVIGATNRIQDVDQAFRRPGRFDEIIRLGLPTQSDREQILKALVSDTFKDQSNLLAKLAEETDGFSGADLAAIVRFAVGLAIEDSRKHLWSMDLEYACQRIRRSKQVEQPQHEVA